MIRFDSKTARKLVHFCTSIVVHFYATLDSVELYPLVANNASEVKLDPSVGRTILRTQADRMKQLGYRFEASQQIWIKK